MADEEHLRVLREGVEAWNRWRQAHPDVRPDFGRADLSEADLGGADLRRAVFWGANLWRVNLREATLSRAILSETLLREAVLDGAVLEGAELVWADLNGTSLSGANLNEAVLVRTNLWGADLSRVNIARARLGGTIFGNVDLSDVKGLESVEHMGPSTIGIDTIYRSHGRIPEAFLRGAGVPDEFIAYMGSLVGRPSEYHSCFISYSSKDQAFAERLHSDLQTKGVRCWYAPQDLRIGDRFRQRIDEAIRVHDTLLLILSEHSVASDWVESEVEIAFEKERRRTDQIVLFPIRVDDAIMATDKAWAAEIRRTRHIGDFTRWEDHGRYTFSLDRLLSDLNAHPAPIVFNT